MILRVALIQRSISALCDGCRQFVTRFTRQAHTGLTTRLRSRLRHQMNGNRRDGNRRDGNS